MVRLLAFITTLIFIILGFLGDGLTKCSSLVEYFGKGEPISYCAVSSFIGLPIIRAAMIDCEEVNISTLISGKSSVDFFYYDGPSSQVKKYYGVRARVRCWVDDRRIWDKALLHEDLMIHAPETICKTIVCYEHTVLPPGVWMIRSNLGHVGSKSRAVDNQAGFKKLFAEFSVPTSGKKDVIIASEYIVDPMLYKDRKFHLRCYIIIAVGKVRSAWMLKHGIMIPAQSKYIAGDWNNQLIHDSHGHDNPEMIYSEEFGRPDLFEKAAEVLGTAMTVMLAGVKNYPETLETGYDILGADVMFWADGRAKIIEINSVPAIGDNSDASKKKIYDALMATVFSSAFGVSRGDPSGVFKLC